MVFDLNKCIGCHTCTMACKTQWTDGRIDIPLENLPDNPEGLLYQYWNNVETMPGRGYPRGIFTKQLAGGFVEPTNPDNWQVDLTGKLPSIHDDYGDPWEYNYDEVLKTEGGDATGNLLQPSPPPDGPDAYASNWDEDVGAGEYPNTHYFYLPRLCNHCTKPACLAACPKNAIYKREEDGVVLIDQDRCEGYRRCIQACPYKKIYYNAAKKRAQKCIFCYPRLEQNTGPDGQQPPRENFCFNQCVGRIRYAGYYDPNLPANHPENIERNNVNRLVDYWGVALRLHPEYGTAPNLFYIPPLSPPSFRDNGRMIAESMRIPIDYLATLFGDDANQTLDQRKARIEEIFAILQSERAKGVDADGIHKSELIRILMAHDETDRLQLYLG
jgi:DMSO reductase family type II enzyme iron-sulfur subunit